MRCKRARSMILDLIDGTLSEGERIRLEEHFSCCPRCEEFASLTKRSLELIRSLPPAQPSSNFNWKLRLRLAREKSRGMAGWDGTSWVVRRWAYRFAAAAAASFLVVVAVGYLYLRGNFIPNAPEDTARPTGVGAETPAVLPPSSGPSLTRGSGVTERLVSQGGPPFSYQLYQPIESSTGPYIIDPDSVVRENLARMRMRYRIRSLKQQVELLQKYLRKCREQNH